MDDLKHPSRFQVNQEPVKNFSPKIKFRFSKPINGSSSSKEESRLQERDKISELKSHQGNIKTHFSVSRKDTHPATDESVHGGNQKITCFVCGKIFPSDKSLHGHMRLHPDRKWRGSKPPPNWNPQSDSSLTVSGSVSSMGMTDYQQQSSSSTSGGSDFDKSLKGWFKTDKRGRRSDMMEAADVLLMLRIGNSLDLAKKDRIRVTAGPDLPMKRRNEEFERGNLESQCKKPKFDEENENSAAGLIPEFLFMDSGMEIPNGFEEFLEDKTELGQVEDTYLLYGMPGNCMPTKSEILMAKFCELGTVNYNETQMSGNRYYCSICNKSFSSYQALGGHKSGHKNYNNSIIHNAGAEEFSIVDVRNQTHVGKLQEFNPPMSKNNVGTHQCKICNKTFATGQALGGHQTLHRLGPTAAAISSVSTLEQTSKECPTSSVSTPEKFIMESSVCSLSPLQKIIKEFSISSAALLDEVGTNTECNIRMELDLNEPPPLDECF